MEVTIGTAFSERTVGSEDSTRHEVVSRDDDAARHRSPPRRRFPPPRKAASSSSSSRCSRSGYNFSLEMAFASAFAVGRSAHWNRRYRSGRLWMGSSWMVRFASRVHRSVFASASAAAAAAAAGVAALAASRSACRGFQRQKLGDGIADGLVRVRRAAILHRAHAAGHLFDRGLGGRQRHPLRAHARRAFAWKSPRKSPIRRRERRARRIRAEDPA